MNKVSVAIPAHNSAATLGRAVKSVIDQKYPNLEITIVDDGSTDDTRNVIRKLVAEHSDTEFNVILHEKNLGRSEARNSAIDNSTGDYIAWLDSDDVWLPTKLEKQISLLENSQDLFHGAICWYYEVRGGNKRSIIPHPKEDAWEIYCLESFNLALGITLVVDRAVYDQIGGYDTQLSRGEDLAWIMKYLKTFKLSLVREPLAIYYNESQINPEEVEKSTAKLLKTYREVYQKYGLRGQRALSKRWIFAARSFAVDGKNPRKVVENILRAYQAYPLQSINTGVLLLKSLWQLLRA